MARNEKQTRKQIIDHRLAEAGWDVANAAQVVEEFDIEVGLPEGVEEPRTKYDGHQFSDYVLLGKDGKPLAVVEAKKTSVDARVGEEQAKQYAYNIQKQYGGELPFCFYTNGLDIYFWDLGNYPPRKVYGFPTRLDLERLQVLRRRRNPLSQELINVDIAGRPYQIEAIRTVMESMERQRRRFLLVMATGTGKTRTTIALVDALMRAGWIEKTLFLVDRIALRNQALDAFKEHLPSEPRWPQEKEKAFHKNRRVYVSTYPTMANLLEREYISPHFFDLMVTDESHRSIYNVYKEVLEYFDGVKLGLTATPTDVIDHNTFKLFECEDGIPTFAYTYDEAVNNIPPYLADFEVLRIQTKFQQEGINKRTISLEDQKRMLAEGKEPEEVNYEGSELEKRVTNRGTNALIVREFMEECIKGPNGVLPGKAIFFCLTKAHARRIKEVFDGLYPEYKGELAKVIVSEDKRVHGKGGLLNQFTKQDMPRVAISVDMLDTGIDVREVVNLVFAKPVYSYTKFWQMIGRGTRLLEPKKIRPWCPEKDKFLIIDCWDNFDYFKLNPKGKEHKEQVALPVRLFGLRLDKVELAMEKEAEDIIIKEIELLRQMIIQLPEKSVVVLDAQVSLEKAQAEEFWNQLTDTKLEFLRGSIRPLMRTISGVDFKAMRFEKDVVETSIALMAEDKERFETLKDALVEQISELPLSINIVRQEQEWIEKAQTNHFWAAVDDGQLDELSRRLAPLMRFRETDTIKREMEKFDFKDLTTSKEKVEFGPENEAISIAEYRRLVEERLRKMASTNLTLQKLKAGLELTDEEVERLAEMLSQQNPFITEELLQRVYDNKKAKFIQFIKHILGLEELATFTDTVARAFEAFIQEHNDYNALQIRFLEVLKSFILEKGTVEKKDLIQTPFNVFHPDGIRGLFRPKDIEEILELTEKVVA